MKEMINFLFLLKLGNRISGAVSQAGRESSWHGNNPRKRGPRGGHRGTVGPWVPFTGAQLPPLPGGIPSLGRGCCLTSFRVALPACVFSTRECHLGYRKAGFGLLCNAKGFPVGHCSALTPVPHPRVPLAGRFRTLPTVTASSLTALNISLLLFPSKAAGSCSLVAKPDKPSVPTRP